MSMIAAPYGFRHQPEGRCSAARRLCENQIPHMQDNLKFKVLILILLVACFVQIPQSAAQVDESIALLEKSFQNPPDDCRIMMRWWWFGPAATKPELQRELEQMKAEGIGGVEIATLYPLALDDFASDQKNGFHNQPFLSDEHIDAIRFAATTARKLGLRVDITLGSGWPFGGPSYTRNPGSRGVTRGVGSRPARSRLGCRARHFDWRATDRCFSGSDESRPDFLAGSEADITD